MYSTFTLRLSLDDIENAYPNGILSERHGCYYFLDMDGDLAYYIQYENGMFEPEVQYVDIDTLAENEAEECNLIAAHIAFNS